MTQTISTSSVVAATKEQVSADLGGEAVILLLKSGVYYGLNDLGTRIWDLVQEPRTVSDVRDVILKEYNVEPDLCERDLLTILLDLAAERLIDVKDQRDG